mmetsp:Transcript_32030/g.77818  ORF Transcript_32030/g.77818 Transcript_32030/m.77818 type:complete len:219 (-) Transcript_32030:524-1180(-)
MRPQEWQMWSHNIQTRDIEFQIRQELFRQLILILTTHNTTAIIFAFSIQEQFVNMFQQQARIRCQNINILENPRKVRFNVIKSFEHLSQIRFNGIQMLFFIEDLFQNGRHVGFQLVQSRIDGWQMRYQGSRIRVHQMGQSVGMQSQIGQYTGATDGLGGHVLLHRTIVLLVVPTNLALDALEFAFQYRTRLQKGIPCLIGRPGQEFQWVIQKGIGFLR